MTISATHCFTYSFIKFSLISSNGHISFVVYFVTLCLPCTNYCCTEMNLVKGSRCLIEVLYLYFSGGTDEN
jgi:hypothetical protein